MKKLFTGVVLVLVIIVAVFLFAKNIIIRIAVEKGVRAVTGLELNIQHLRVGLVATDVHIKGLKLFNPAGFEDKLMIDIPEVYVNYDLFSLLKKEIYLKEARIYLKEFFVVKTADGRMNLDALKALQPKGAETQGKDAPSGTKSSQIQIPPLKIDLLELKVDQVFYKEYRSSGDPRVKEFRVFIDEKYRDIADAKSLMSTIVLKSLGKTALLSLANLDFGSTAQTVDAPIKAAEDVTKGAVNVAEDTIKTTAEGIKNIIKLPFSKE